MNVFPAILKSTFWEDLGADSRRLNIWETQVMIIIDGIPHFGTKQTEIDYILRPSVYALALDTSQQIAIVKHKGAFFLPGGGIEPGENFIEALQREISEETGYKISAVVELSKSVEYLQGVDGKYYRIHSTFFRAWLDTKGSTFPEPDHQLIWMRLENAIPKMQRACHRWVIESFNILDEAKICNQ